MTGRVRKPSRDLGSKHLTVQLKAVDRQRHRQTDRQRERQRDKQTDRHTDRQ